MLCLARKCLTGKAATPDEAEMLEVPSGLKTLWMGVPERAALCCQAKALEVKRRRTCSASILPCAMCQPSGRSQRKCVESNAGSSARSLWLHETQFPVFQNR